MSLNLFANRKPVIGVIHLLPLPGSHRYDGLLEPVFLRAEQEAASLTTGGVDGIIVENFFDAPFRKNDVDKATVCALALIVQRIRAITHLPLGINVLRNDALSAMAIAATAGAQFIRVNVFTGAMLTDQGIIEGQAPDILLYRKMLGCEDKIKILADVMVKHASPLTPFADIRQIAKDTVERGQADAVIVSGVATGSAPNLEELQLVKEAVPHVPVFVGSGTTSDNAPSIVAHADGIIVASSLKRQGKLENPIDVERVRTLVSAVRGAVPN
jgi:uncharacterized protein